MKRLPVILVLLLITSSGVANAQEGIDNTDLTPEQFRSALLDYISTLESKAEPGTTARYASLIERILSLDEEQLETYLGGVSDPSAFVELLRKVTRDIARGHAGPTEAESELEQRRALDQAALAMAPQLFYPDYPPASGTYKSKILQELFSLNLLPSNIANTERCGINKWADDWKLWEEAEAVARHFAVGCTLAGCDPTGLICSGTCAVWATAEEVALFAAIPIVLCDAHIGNIDSAEIEAAYENSKIISGQISETSTALMTHDTDIKNLVNQHDTDIKTVVNQHDTDIKNALTQHDTDIKALLAEIQAAVNANGEKLDLLLSRQLEVVRLLHTPSGRRSTTVPACDGEGCEWVGPNER